MKRILRIDDFPHGSRADHSAMTPTDCRAFCELAVESFENHGAEYLLGVSPLLLDKDDLDWLNRTVKVGKVVMHGFNHGWSFSGRWEEVVQTWAGGGEFLDMSAEEVRHQYSRADAVLKGVHRYDPAHFVPPFNVYNQALLDALQDSPVEYLHGCNHHFMEYKLRELNHGKFQPLLSDYNITYAHADIVLRNLYMTVSPVTLHWIYDRKRADWLDLYEQIARQLKEAEHAG